MKVIRELIESADIEELEKEWKERAWMKQNLVGQLYPSILQDEMIRIQNRIANLKHPQKETKS